MVQTWPIPEETFSGSSPSNVIPDIYKVSWKWTFCNLKTTHNEPEKELNCSMSNDISFQFNNNYFIPWRKIKIYSERHHLHFFKELFYLEETGIALAENNPMFCIAAALVLMFQPAAHGAAHQRREERSQIKINKYCKQTSQSATFHKQMSAKHSLYKQ